MKYMLHANQMSTEVVSSAAKYKTLDQLRFENYTGKKASLINTPLTLSNSIYIAVSLSSTSKLVYLTKQKVMQIHAKLIGKVKVTLH